MTKLKIITWNISGICDKNKFYELCVVLKVWIAKDITNGLCAQEHNLDPARRDEYFRTANDLGLHLAIGFSTSPCHRGGALILSCRKSMPLSKIIHEDPQLVRAQYDFNGDIQDVASVYAPSEPLKRVDFFSHLKTRLSALTIAGGDWNCVPDVTLDVKGKNQLSYPNVGARQLGTVMGAWSLIDYRREQLGTDFEYTRKGTDETTVITRIDRWYLPTGPAHANYLWDIHPRNDLVISTTVKDHLPLVLTIEPVEGERGHERSTIREDLCCNPWIQGKIKEITLVAHQGNGPKVNKWCKAMRMIADWLLDETEKKKKKERIEERAIRAQLTITMGKINAEGPTKHNTDTENRLKTELYNLQHPEAPHLASAAKAKSMTDRSEACTFPFFKTYKDISKQSWINEINVTIWEEDVEAGQPKTTPVVTGTVKKPALISGELAKYYIHLFCEKKIVKHDKDAILRRLKKKAIQPTSADNLERDVEDEEVRKVMDNLPMGKQAGPHRVPNGVFRCMSAFFAPYMAAIIRDTANGKAALPPHFLEGDICVLYKKKGRLEPTNYRPLTMLNTDYKVFTKVLANRLKTVVHEFVSNMQKGFVPDVFIAECTMALTMIENWVNEEPTERQGAFLFLDMEKAFDRVSYQFLTESMVTLGFGPKFCRLVGSMYNTDKPPRRRVFANGYYSEWFPIKSGVAQGCPLSPLLFLIVAEGLKISLDMEHKFKGIRIGGKYYKLSQFADDTTLIFGSLSELIHAEEGILRWCRATGMRENKSKREGLAMGRFREQHLAPGTQGPRPDITTLPPNVDWKEEGDYATCLGVPIGNDLDTEKWWRKKLASVENLSKKWTGLFRNGYFGRNLVVQAMFLGRLRYWLYSVPMSKVVCAMVQDDADTLWWSKEPVIGGEKKRFRRFVGKQTAIGPRVKGGLGNVDWFSHVQSFMSSWITRYVDAADSQWKNLLDTFVLYDQRGKRRFPEGRGIFYANISKYDQYAILKNIPRRAVYIKECIRAHFKLEIQPNLQPYEDMPDTLPSEPFFRSHRFNLGIPKKDQEYYYTKLGISRMADLVHPKTRMVRTPQQWAHLVLRRGMEETRWTGHLAEHATWALGDDVAKNAAIDRANTLCAIVRKIPPGILAWLEVHMQMSAPKADELRCMLGTDGWMSVGG